MWRLLVRRTKCISTNAARKDAARAQKQFNYASKLKPSVCGGALKTLVNIEYFYRDIDGSQSDQFSKRTLIQLVIARIKTRYSRLGLLLAVATITGTSSSGVLRVSVSAPVCFFTWRPQPALKLHAASG